MQECKGEIKGSQADPRDYYRKIQWTKRGGPCDGRIRRIFAAGTSSAIQAGQRYSWRNFRVFEFQTSDSPLLSPREKESERKRERIEQ